MTNTWALSALWLGLALTATQLAIWFKISTALSEICGWHGICDCWKKPVGIALRWSWSPPKPKTLNWADDSFEAERQEGSCSNRSQR